MNDVTESGGATLLTDSAAGRIFQVQDVTADGDNAIRLKRLGICAGRRIVLVQNGDPLIVLVVGSRIGISRQLAECIRVVPCEAS